MINDIGKSKGGRRVEKKRSVYFITQAESATFTLFPFFEAFVRSKVDIPGRCLAADELKAIFR